MEEEEDRPGCPESFRVEALPKQHVRTHQPTHTNTPQRADPVAPPRQPESMLNSSMPWGLQWRPTAELNTRDQT